MTKQIDWWSAQEIADEISLIRRVDNGDIRQCSQCGAYVNVEDFASESKVNNVYDICIECEKALLKDIDTDIEIVEENCYEDYLEEEDLYDSYE